MHGVTVDGNVFEFNWIGFQDGYAVLSLNEASWQVLRGERVVQAGESIKPARGRKVAKPVSSAVTL